MRIPLFCFPTIWIAVLFLLAVFKTIAVNIKSGDKILFVGDSIVRYGNFPNGFLPRVRALLENYGVIVGGMKVIFGPEANSSLESIYQTVVDYVEAAPAENLPKTVIIFWGTDHVRNGGRIEEYVGASTIIVDEFRKNPAFENILLASPSIIGEKYDNTNGFDDKLELTAAEGEILIASLTATKLTNASTVPTAHIEFIDIYFAMLKRLERVNFENLPASVLTFDGQRYNNAGNDFVASLFASALCERCKEALSEKYDSELADHHLPAHVKLNPQFFSSKQIGNQTSYDGETESKIQDSIHTEL